MAVTMAPPAHREDVFTAVFAPKNHTTPTPEATPNTGTLASPGTPFGGFNVTINAAADEATMHSRAWSMVTRFLALSAGLTGPRDLAISPETAHALDYLLSSDDTRKELFDWYMHEVSTHFRHFILPELSFWQHPLPLNKTRDVFSKTVQVLSHAQNLYLSIGRHDDFGPAEEPLQEIMTRIKQDFHVLVLNSLPRQRIQKTLASYLFQSMKSSLQESSNPEICLKVGHCRCCVVLDLEALRELQEVGLGGSHGARAFAHALHKFLEGPAVERKCFRVDWNQQTSVIAKLRIWVENQLLPSVQQAVATLTDEAELDLPIAQFISAAVSSFGRQRVSALFEYVNSWPASEGAILDIKEYIGANGAAEKVQLCSSFTDQIQTRLLHAGASTTEILSVYINVISVFKLIDARGVLLDKVAIPIRSYLRNREDTAQVIASSLLAEVDNTGQVYGHDPEKICADIAIEIAKSAIDAQDDRLLNWDDMEWVPDPIDAGPNYRSLKSDDVVAYVLGLFDPDDFVKALAATLGDHLIHTSDPELAKELRLVELLKSRLDASRLQQAEVMLKDMRDSVIVNRRINPTQHFAQTGSKPTPNEIKAALPEGGITLVSLWDQFRGRMEAREFSAILRVIARKSNDLYFPKRTRARARNGWEPVDVEEEDVPVHFEAKVISGAFWPQLRDTKFVIPDEIKQHMARYEQQFTAISGQRKLEWQHGAGTGNIRLQFEDRLVEESRIEEWKVVLIQAFGRDDYDNSDGMSVPELMTLLEMEEELVLGAVSFWIGKRVLYEKFPGTFAVLERLDMQVEQVEESQVDFDAFAAVKTDATMLKESAVMYQNFIEGMLRNQGAKQIEGMMGITSVLKMVLSDFTYGDEDVKWLLEDMESQGKVKSTGGGMLWSIAE